MKIMILAAGSDIHSVRWANQLSDNGNEVHLCYVSNQKPSTDKFTHSIVLHELKYPAPYGYYLNVSQLKKIIKKVKPDVLNSHYSSGYGTLGRLTNYTPYLISVYGSDVYDFPYKSRINMSIIRKNLNSACEIASTSHAMALQTTRLIDKVVSEIHITPFGVNIEKFKKVDKSKNDNQFIIGSIKKLSSKYGIRYGILAVDFLIKNLLYNNSLKVKYYIYGEGDEKSELIDLVKRCGLEEVVEFKGRIPNDAVPGALNELDVFLGTSILDSESFGVSIVEAMACEVPVIVTDVDGFSEVVDGGKYGIIVPREDYKAIANSIYELISDSNLRMKMGKIQRDHVVSNYNWLDNVRTMEIIYENLQSISFQR